MVVCSMQRSGICLRGPALSDACLVRRLVSNDDMLDLLGRHQCARYCGEGRAQYLHLMQGMTRTLRLRAYIRRTPCCTRRWSCWRLLARR